MHDLRAARRRPFRTLLAATLLLLASVLSARPPVAPACDLCAIYTATDLIEGRTGFRAGFAEQYTQFATEQLDGTEVPNEFGEHLYSSNTQVFLGYQFTRRFGLQLNLPILYKSWRRVLEDGDLQESTRGGIGDMTLLANFLAYDAMWDNATFRFNVLGGLKFPTGDADFLAEELAEDEGEAGTARIQHDGEQHGDFPSGVHGHDLTFGSGSVDGVVGGNLYWSFHRFFLTTAMQYKVTTDGAFDYQFANDLTWLGGPGYYALLDDEYTLSVAALLSGETKGFDTQHGETLDDTALTALYVGPGLGFTWQSQISAELAADLPVVQNNSALQIVPDFRLRAALVWRF